MTTLTTANRNVAIYNHVVGQVCAAVEAMHAHQPPCAHWDIKPGNVLLQLDGVAPAEALPSRAPATTSSSPPTRSRKKEARSAEEARAGARSSRLIRLILQGGRGACCHGG